MYSEFLIVSQVFVKHKGLWFLLAFIILYYAEKYWPRIKTSDDRRIGIITNIALLLLIQVSVEIINPVASELVFNTFSMGDKSLINLLKLQGFERFIALLLMTDFALYFQHLIGHKVSLLWRFHRVHHTDSSVDFSTTGRFHPLGVPLRFLVQLPMVVLIGPDALELFILLFLSSFYSVFTHANINIPERLDKYLELIFVTPDMHRIHHSQDIKETDSNYGFIFSFWDRLFRTKTRKDYDKQKDIKIGLKEVSKENSSRLLKALAIPFLNLSRSKAPATNPTET